MGTRCHVATRKGLFTLDRSASGWTISRTSFLGDNCTLVMHDPEVGICWPHQHRCCDAKRHYSGEKSQNQSQASEELGRDGEGVAITRSTENAPAPRNIKNVVIASTSR